MKNIVLFKKIPRENKLAYLVSAGIGAGFSVLMMYVNTFIDYDFNRRILFLLLNSLFSIFILIFLFMLSKKSPIVWGNVKTRIMCVVILSMVCIYSYDLIHLVVNGDNLYKVFFLPVWIFFGVIIQFIDFVSLSSLMVFLFPNIFIIIVAYLTTKGIKNLITKIILFFLVGFLIHVASTIPLIIRHTLT